VADNKVRKTFCKNGCCPRWFESGIQGSGTETIARCMAGKLRQTPECMANIVKFQSTRALKRPSDNPIGGGNGTS